MLWLVRKCCDNINSDCFLFMHTPVVTHTHTHTLNVATNKHLNVALICQQTTSFTHSKWNGQHSVQLSIHWHWLDADNFGRKNCPKCAMHTNKATKTWKLLFQSIKYTIAAPANKSKNVCWCLINKYRRFQQAIDSNFDYNNKNLVAAAACRHHRFALEWDSARAHTHARQIHKTAA